MKPPPALPTSKRIDALDGLRGFALLGMMAWHAEVSWIKGGFARMTIFFVLAGFLAMRSLTRATGATMPKRFMSFWSRRAQRLLPVTLVAVAVAIAVTRQWGGPAATRSVLGDSTSVLTFWSNWRFVIEQRSYGEMFEAPSAFTHFWSLSLEEQCLFILPLLLVLIAAVTRDRPAAASRRTIGAVLAVGALCSGLPLVVNMSPDTAYYGTHVRLGEFCVGVALALWWSTQTPGSWSTWQRRGWAAAGTLSFALLVAIMLLVDRTSAWVYRGGMGLIAIPVAAVLVAIMAGTQPLNRVLSIWPLAACGRAAFSIYALHWPIYLIVTAHASGRSHNEVVLLSFAAALTAGTLVYLGFERPLMASANTRISRWWARPRLSFPVAGVAAVGVLVFAQSTPVIISPSTDFEELAADETIAVTMSLDEALTILGDPNASVPVLPIARDEFASGIAMFGGSTALSFALGSGEWDATANWAQTLPGYAPLGCGLIDSIDRGGGNNPGNNVANEPPPAECAERVTRWMAASTAYRVDIAIIVASSADVTTHRFAPDGPWLALGDPEVDGAVRSELLATVDGLHSVGVDKVFVTNHVGPYRGLDDTARSVRRARIEAYDAIVTDLERQGIVEVIDVLGWSDSLDDETYASVFPDGVHASTSGASRAWAELFGPSITPRG